MACEPPPKRSKKEVTEHGDDILESYMAKRKEVCKSVTDFKFNKKRVRLISFDADIPENCKGIAYWMWREQRVQGWFKLTSMLLFKLYLFFDAYYKRFALTSKINNFVKNPK